MLEIISSFPSHPPLADPTCSVKNRPMSTNEGFPSLLVLCDKAPKSLSKLLRRSSGFCCVNATRSPCTNLLTTAAPAPELEEEAADPTTWRASLMSFSTAFVRSSGFPSGPPVVFATVRFKCLQKSTNEGLSWMPFFKRMESISAFNHAFRPSGCCCRSSARTVLRYVEIIKAPEEEAGDADAARTCSITSFNTFSTSSGFSNPPRLPQPEICSSPHNPSRDARSRPSTGKANSV